MRDTAWRVRCTYIFVFMCIYTHIHVYAHIHAHRIPESEERNALIILAHLVLSRKSWTHDGCFSPSYNDTVMVSFFCTENGVCTFSWYWKIVHKKISQQGEHFTRILLLSPRNLHGICCVISSISLLVIPRMRKTPGGVLVGGRVKSDETLGNGVVVRSLY